MSSLKEWWKAIDEMPRMSLSPQQDKIVHEIKKRGAGVMHRLVINGIRGDWVSESQIAVCQDAHYHAALPSVWHNVKEHCVFVSVCTPYEVQDERDEPEPYVPLSSQQTVTRP